MSETEFPHATLRTSDATPRIDPKLAEEVIELIAEATELGIVNFPNRPAICIAVFTGSLVKWLVNEGEAGKTADNLRKAILAEREKIETAAKGKEK